MSLEVQKIERVFVYKDKQLKDINESYSEEQILDVYSEQYPELVNSRVDGPEMKDGKAIFNFVNNVGSKG